MPQYLRTIRRGRWLPPEWIHTDTGQIQADALSDLATRHNLLSVYLAESSENIERIIIALAATRDHVQNVDYAFLDDAAFVQTGVTATLSAGTTPDPMVNNLHYDLGALTAEQISSLAAVIRQGKIFRILSRDIEAGLRKAIQTGSLNTTDINDKLLSKFL